MPAQRKDLVHDAGTNFNLAVQYQDYLGNPVDLTTFTAVLTVYKKNTEEVILTSSRQPGDDGWIFFNILSTSGITWPVGKTAYTLDLKDELGNLTGVLYGELNVRSRVSL